MFTDKKIILGVTGGIAAYKAAEFARLLMKKGADVHVVMTPSAQKFIGSVTFHGLTGNQVHTDFWSSSTDPYPHITLSKMADACIALPVTANSLARIASGFCDRLFETIFQATDAPTFLCPAMNSRMWHSPSVQRNLKQLEGDGHHIIYPESGDLACGESGDGRLASLDLIMKHLEDYFVPDSVLLGKKVLITAGPTREYIDDIRFLSNRATGQFAHLLTQHLISNGAAVTVISGPTHYHYDGAQVHSIETTREMFRVLESEYDRHDVVINTAAVSDLTFDRHTGKLKKTEGIMKKITDSMVINRDLLQWQIHHKKNQFLVGFALEESVSLGFDKLQRKPVDLLFVNQVSEMGTDHISPTILSATGDVLFQRSSLPKSEAAKILVDILKKRVK